MPDEVLRPGSAKAATMLQPQLSAAVEPAGEHSVQAPVQSSASEQTNPSEPPKKKGETHRCQNAFIHSVERLSRRSRLPRCLAV